MLTQYNERTAPSDAADVARGRPGVGAGIRTTLSSQNPESFGTFDAPKVAAHLSRLAALRVFAKANGYGYGYVPILETFLSQPGGGASLVSADGITDTLGRQPHLERPVALARHLPVLPARSRAGEMTDLRLPSPVCA